MKVEAATEDSVIRLDGFVSLLTARKDTSSGLSARAFNQEHKVGLAAAKLRNIVTDAVSLRLDVPLVLLKWDGGGKEWQVRVPTDKKESVLHMLETQLGTPAKEPSLWSKASALLSSKSKRVAPEKRLTSLPDCVHPVSYMIEEFLTEHQTDSDARIIEDVITSLGRTYLGDYTKTGGTFKSACQVGEAGVEPGMAGVGWGTVTTSSFWQVPEPLAWDIPAQFRVHRMGVSGLAHLDDLCLVPPARMSPVGLPIQVLNESLLWLENSICSYIFSEKVIPAELTNVYVQYTQDSFNRTGKIREIPDMEKLWPPTLAVNGIYQTTEGYMLATDPTWKKKPGETMPCDGSKQQIKETFSLLQTRLVSPAVAFDPFEL